MTHFNQPKHPRILRSIVSTAFIILISTAQANPVFEDTVFSSEQNLTQTGKALKEKKAKKLTLDCSKRPEALKHIIENKFWPIDQLNLTISGQCRGPLKIAQTHLSISGDAVHGASIVVDQPQDTSAIVIQSAVVTLRNVHINVPIDVPALLVKANSNVALDQITTNAISSTDTPLEQFTVSENSTLYLTRMSGSHIRVSKNSFADFQQENQDLTLNVTDTSSAQSSTPNQFTAVQVSGNGYFLADQGTRIQTLMIWSKAAVDINQQSSVGHLMMGGQTYFAAFKNSSITGPYDLWGNVVFELEHATAENWKAVNQPHSIISGNNATVNGILYPGWSWTGQDGNESGSQPAQ
ncbi:hypothetical protein [Photobacterium sp. R1]